MSELPPPTYQEMLRAFAAAEASLPTAASHGHFELALELGRSMLNDPAFSGWHASVLALVESRLHLVEERIRLTINNPLPSNEGLRVLIANLHLFNDPELGVSPDRINVDGLDELIALVKTPYESLTVAEHVFLTSQLRRLGFCS